MSDYKLVPVEPTPEMVDAAADAYMPFGDMDLAIRMAILAAPAVQGEPVGYLHKRPERIPCFFESYDEAMLSGCEVVPVYTHPQPAPDTTLLVEALEQVIKAAPSSGPLWHGSEQIVEARAALATHQKREGE